jgi:hypothetical protein
MVYTKGCQVGGKLTLDDLEATEIGDWKMPDFKSACAYAASQGWVAVTRRYADTDNGRRETRLASKDVVEIRTAAWCGVAV